MKIKTYHEWVNIIIYKGSYCIPQCPKESNKLFEEAVEAVSDLLVTVLKKDVSSDTLDSIFKVSSPS